MIAKDWTDWTEKIVCSQYREMVLLSWATNIGCNEVRLGWCLVVDVVLYVWLVSHWSLVSVQHMLYAVQYMVRFWVAFYPSNQTIRFHTSHLQLDFSLSLLTLNICNIQFHTPLHTHFSSPLLLLLTFWFLV